MDAAAWRTAEEVAALRARDPLAALEDAMLRRGIAAEALAAVRAEAEAEMRLAREAARAAPWPDPASAWADVQDSGAEGAFA
jgi:pyruvate dehydrogenase E1 component alpha subunit